MNVEVAKAIGWTDGLCEECDDFHAWACPYTVDDLLGHLTAIADDQDGTQITVVWTSDGFDVDDDKIVPPRHFIVERVVFDEDSRDEISRWWIAPTLLEALEQAVLAVVS